MSNQMPDTVGPMQLIKVLLPHLPRHAEEEGDGYGVSRQSLLDALCQQGAERLQAATLIDLIEALLSTLAVLDRAALQQGEWRFVSFPAQLLALSILTAMGDGDSQLFASHFWNTQGIGNDRKDQQRAVLRWLEQARFQHHSQQQAQPIRFCYVAWGIIKLGDQVLFYQREDTQKRFDSTAGDYGLLGGRANQWDVGGEIDGKQLLSELQSPDSSLIKNALPATLQRELAEEAGLQLNTHYRFESWRQLPAYRQIQGAAPNHALTEYLMEVFRLDLSLEGYLWLLRKVESDRRLAWISLNDLRHGKTADGKIPYIYALDAAFAGERGALVDVLATLPESFSAGYLFAPKKYGVTLPISEGKPVLTGVLGKEKPLSLVLSSRQHGLLLALAAHLRGFAFADLIDGVLLHPHGWLEVADSALQAELTVLAALLKDSDLVMENQRDRYFRLSVAPSVVFFDDELFGFSVVATDLNKTDSKISVMLERCAFSTAIGAVKAHTVSLKLSLELVHQFKQLAEQDFATDNDKAIRIEDAYKKGLHQDAAFCALGLRNLIRRENGRIKFVALFKCI